MCSRCCNSSSCRFRLLATFVCMHGDQPMQAGDEASNRDVWMRQEATQQSQWEPSSTAPWPSTAASASSGLDRWWESGRPIVTRNPTEACETWSLQRCKGLVAAVGEHTESRYSYLFVRGNRKACWQRPILRLYRGITCGAPVSASATRQGSTITEPSPSLRQSAHARPAQHR